MSSAARASSSGRFGLCSHAVDPLQYQYQQGPSMSAAEIRYGFPAEPGLVSVVIPCHNSRRLVGETLNSVGRQTYPQWEVWVVEDGTDDGTESIVAEFARRFPGHRVEYRRNPKSGGPSLARNTAFHGVRGEFVALVDSDDRWMPDHLAVSVDALRNRQLDIVYSTVIMVEDLTDRPIGMLGPSEAEEASFERSMFGRNLVVPSATVMRREVLSDIGESDLRYRYCQDYDHSMRAIVAGKRFGHVGGVHCLYRKGHREALTRNMARLITEAMTIADSYLEAPIPSVSLKARRKIISDGYRFAAMCHWRGDPSRDPSADPSLAPALTWRAWQLRPKRLKLLARWVWQTVAVRFRTARPVTAPSPVAAALPAEPLRSAA
jgi:GT2 family glycosyltransferase